MKIELSPEEIEEADRMLNTKYKISEEAVEFLQRLKTGEHLNENFLKHASSSE